MISIYKNSGTETADNMNPDIRVGQQAYGVIAV